MVGSIAEIGQQVPVIVVSDGERCTPRRRYPRSRKAPGGCWRCARPVTSRAPLAYSAWATSRSGSGSTGGAGGETRTTRRGRRHRSHARAGPEAPPPAARHGADRDPLGLDRAGPADRPRVRRRGEMSDEALDLEHWPGDLAKTRGGPSARTRLVVKASSSGRASSERVAWNSAATHCAPCSSALAGGVDRRPWWRRRWRDRRVAWRVHLARSRRSNRSRCVRPPSPPR